LQKHNLGGTASTRPGRPWKLVYTETLQTKTDALVREKQIKKKKSRKYIEWLIRSDTEAVK
jgi:putative endonuclease